MTVEKDHRISKTLYRNGFNFKCFKEFKKEKDGDKFVNNVNGINLINFNFSGKNSWKISYMIYKSTIYINILYIKLKGKYKNI